MITIVGTMIVGLSACQNTQMASKEAISATGSSEQMQDDSIASAQAAADAAEPNRGDEQPKDENVVDADFEEVKEDSKQA